MEVLSKLADSLSMFWQALDDRERLIVGYTLSVLAVTVGLSMADRQRRRREQRLLTMILTEVESRGVR